MQAAEFGGNSSSWEKPQRAPPT